jgi:hypothetical protein
LNQWGSDFEVFLRLQLNSIEHLTTERAFYLGRIWVVRFLLRAENLLPLT